MNIFELWGKVGIKDGASDALNNIEKAADNVGKKITKMSDSLAKSGKSISKFGGELTKKVSLPIIAMGTASFMMAADVEDALGATEQIYKKSADTIKNWAKDIKSYYGITEGSALEYSNMMGSMLMNIGGLSEDAAAKQAIQLTQLAGDLSAMFGGTTESAVNALTGALKGNNSMLDNYGMGVNDATVKAKAFEMGLYSGKGAMSLQTKQAATLALIMEQTADAQGQAGREALGASGSMKSLTTEIKNLAADIGNILLPVVTPIIQSIGEWVAKFKELSPEMKETIIKVALFAAVMGPVIIVIGKVVSAAAFLIGIYGKLQLAGGLLTIVTTGLGGAFAFLTSPITLTIAAIALLVAGFIYAWKNIDGFKEGVMAILNKLAEMVTYLFTGLWKDVVYLVGALVEGAKERFNNLKTAVGNIFNGIKNAIMWPIEKARDGIKSIIDKIKGFFTGMKLEIPKIKLPTLPKPKIEGKFSFGPPPTVPKIKWNAEGGIFDSATIFNTNKGLQGVGEAGAEAIMPLDKLKSWITDSIGNSNKGLELALAGSVNGMSGRSPQADKGNSIVINISGDWTVDSDDRQRDVVEEMNTQLFRALRSGGFR